MYVIQVELEFNFHKMIRRLNKLIKKSYTRKKRDFPGIALGKLNCNLFAFNVRVTQHKAANLTNQ